MDQIATYYTDIINPYNQAVQMATDAWFVSGVNLILEALSGQAARTVGTVYYFVFAQQTNDEFAVQYPWLGAAHGWELDYVLGFYTEGKAYITLDMPFTMTYPADELALGATLKGYWLNHMYTGSPNVEGDGMLEWLPYTPTETHTMIFKASYPDSCALDPCVNLHACSVETTADFRAAKKSFWNTYDRIPTPSSCSVGSSGPSQIALGETCPDHPPSPPPAPNYPGNLQMGYVGDMGTPIAKATTLGPITGRVDANGIERYYGIPTGATTAGNNRWRAPQPTSWTVPIDTVRERICMCHGGAVGQEDCMSIDVMTATVLVDAATFVYTHGGGFMGEDPPYEHQTMAYYQRAGVAAYLPNEGRAVTALMHYRLGPLGFMAHPGLSMETSYGASGNWGVMDVLHNMAWLQSNVATFGGAPSLVTLVGESAGAAMV
jgi:carboxylesterase type B